MAHPSTSTTPSKDILYLSDIITGAHGDRFQKDLALVMFERATRNGYDFRMGYEMAIADKFDDVAFFNRIKNEWTLIQTKHADTSKGAPAPLKYDTLFPKDEITREKGDFSLFKYLKSYMTVQANIKERKNVIIFTNRDFLRDSLEPLVEVADRQVDDILLFDNAIHVRLKVKSELIKEVLDYVNRDFNSLRDSIVKLFKEEILDETIKKFKTPVASFLTKTNTGVCFMENISSDAYQLLQSLSSVIDTQTLQLPLSKCKDLFTGSSRNKTLPLFATEQTVRQFFEDLILSVRQPDDLGVIIDQDLRLWMRTWIRPDYLTRLEEPQLKMSAVSLEEFFNHQQTPEISAKAGRPYKKFLQLVDGEKFYCNIRKDLTKQIKNLSNYNGDNACEYYISRQIVYLDKCEETPKTDRYDSDELSDNESYTEKGESIRLLRAMPRDLDYTCDRDRCVEMKIRDENFVRELFGEFENEKFLLLTAEPGMGKSTIFRFIALAAQQNSDVCVYLFHLNTFHQKFEEMEYTHSFDQFLSILGTVLSETSFRNLQDTFKNNDNQKKHLLIFDALDEVSLRNRIKIIHMFRRMMTVPNVKILVSARKNVKVLLENAFAVRAMSLEPFDYQDQKNYLRQFWKVPAESESNFLKYVDHLFNVFYSGFNRAFCEFTGLPLMLKMLAEVYTDHFQEYLGLEGNDFVKLIPQERFSIINLYEQFVRKCFVNKMVKKNGNLYLDIDREYDSLFETYMLQHQLLAIKNTQIKGLQTIFKDAKYFEALNEFEQRILNGTEKSSLIESVGNEIRFIHRSYAEFLVAKFLFSNIKQFKVDIFSVKSRKIFLSENPMVRVFFFTMIEEQFITKHLKILKRYYSKNSDIALWACEVYGEKTIHYLLRTKSDSTIINRLFYVAAEYNCYKICTYLLENHQVTMDWKLQGWTPLQTAAKKGFIDIVKLLLYHSADVHVTDTYGWTPLHFAAYNGHVEIVKILIYKRADVNAKSENGWTPLHHAAKNSHPEVVKVLLDKFADIDMKQKDDLTALHFAAAFGHREVVKILTENLADVNAQETENWTPLHFAAQNDHAEIVNILIDKTADVNAKTTNDITPLHIAALVGHSEIIKILIEKCAHINAKEITHWMPLHFAAQNGHSEAVKILIEKFSDANAQEIDGWTPLHLAAINGHLEVVKLLISESANVNAKEHKDWTPLHFAAQNGHLGLVKLLITKFADINAQQIDGYTPLHVAAGKGHLEVVKLLVECLADTDALDSTGLTPLYHAIANSHKDVVKMLAAIMKTSGTMKSWPFNMRKRRTWCLS